MHIITLNYASRDIDGHGGPVGPSLHEVGLGAPRNQTAAAVLPPDRHSNPSRSMQIWPCAGSTGSTAVANRT